MTYVDEYRDAWPDPNGNCTVCDKPRTECTAWNPVARVKVEED